MFFFCQQASQGEMKLRLAFALQSTDVIDYRQTCLVIIPTKGTCNLSGLYEESRRHMQRLFLPRLVLFCVPQLFCIFCFCFHLECSLQFSFFSLFFSSNVITDRFKLL